MNINESIQVSFQQFFCSPDPLHLPQHQQQPPTSSTFFNNDNSNAWHQPSFSSSSSFNHNRSSLSLNYNHSHTSYRDTSSYPYNNTPPFAPPATIPRSYVNEHAQIGQQQFYENDFVTMREESILQTITNLNAEYTGMNDFSMCLNRDPKLEPTFSPKCRPASDNKSSSQFDAIQRKPLVPEPLKRKRPADGSLETLSKPSESKRRASSMSLKYSASSALTAHPHIPDQILQRSSSSAVTDLRNECPFSGNPRILSDSWVVSQKQSGASVTDAPYIPDQRPSTSANTNSYSDRSNVSDSWNVSQRQLGAPVTDPSFVLDESSQRPIYAMNDPRFSSSAHLNVSDSRHVFQRQSRSAMSYPSSSSSHVPERPSSSSLPDPRNEFTYSWRQYDSRNVSQRSSGTPVSNHPYYTPDSRNTSQRPSNYFTSNSPRSSRTHQQPSTFAVTDPTNEYPAFDHRRNVNDSRNSCRKPLNYFISY